MNTQSYESNCVQYGVTLSQENYLIDGVVPSPPILQLTVNFNDSIYAVHVGDFFVTYDILTSTINQSDGVSVIYNNNILSLSLLNNGNNYISKDTYNIKLGECYSCNFVRYLDFSGEYTAKTFSSCNNNIKYTVQSNNVGTDLSNILYSIKNTTTESQKVGGIYKYLKGTKNNSRDRVYDIWVQSSNQVELPIIFFEFLLQNIYYYSTLKCILCKLLYGNYDNKYLLNSYNKKFYCDLKNSVYSDYIYYFCNCESPFFGLEFYFDQ